MRTVDCQRGLGRVCAPVANPYPARRVWTCHAPPRAFPEMLPVRGAAGHLHEACSESRGSGAGLDRSRGWYFDILRGCLPGKVQFELVPTDHIRAVGPRDLNDHRPADRCDASVRPGVVLPVVDQGGPLRARVLFRRIRVKIDPASRQRYSLEQDGAGYIMPPDIDLHNTR